MQRRDTCEICRKTTAGWYGGAHHRLPMQHHYRNVHPEAFEAFKAECDGLDRERKAKERAAEQEVRDRAVRQIVVTGAFLDEIACILRGTADMMEPYYSQADGDRSAREMIDALDAIARGDRDALSEEHRELLGAALPSTTEQKAA